MEGCNTNHQRFLLTIGTLMIKAKCEIGLGLGERNDIDMECILPRTNVFAVGSKVMLLVNYIVEYNLFNEEIGTVVGIIYHPEETPQNSVFPAYVVFNFPECAIPMNLLMIHQSKTCSYFSEDSKM